MTQRSSKIVGEGLTGLTACVAFTALLWQIAHLPLWVALVVTAVLSAVLTLRVR